MSATGRRDGGSTLIEMLVVIGILGLVSALIFPAWISPLRAAQLYEARSALAANLRTARALAIRGGAPVSLELTQDARGYAWGGTRAYLPAPVSITAPDGAIVFFADGSSSGGSLVLSEKQRAVSVTVDALTGLAGAGAR
jgi:general secretion pathway protein H